MEERVEGLWGHEVLQADLTPHFQGSAASQGKHRLLHDTIRILSYSRRQNLNLSSKVV